MTDEKKAIDQAMEAAVAELKAGMKAPAENPLPAEEAEAAAPAESAPEAAAAEAAPVEEAPVEEAAPEEAPAEGTE